MRYLIRRLGFFVLTLWAAMTLNFFIPRMMPGSPEQALRERFSKGGSVVSPEQLRTVLAEFGFDPDKNIVLQYGEYLKAMVTGHWGVSIGSSLGVPVTTLIGDALPWTLGLVGIATVLAFVARHPDRHDRRLAARRADRRDRAAGLHRHLGTAVLLGRRCC